MMKQRIPHLAKLLAIAIALAVAACSCRPPKTETASFNHKKPAKTEKSAKNKKASKANTMNDDLFFSVPLPTYSKSRCTPELEWGKVGMRISAPARLDIARRDSFPLCGTIRIYTREMFILRGHAIESTVVVVTSKAGGKPLAFNLGSKGTPLQKEEAPQNLPAFNPTSKRKDSFNVDLYHFSSELRKRLVPGRYVIYATLRKYKSNAIEVEVFSSSKGSK